MKSLKTVVAAILVAAMAVATTGCAAQVERRVDNTPTLYIGSVVPSFPTSFMPWQSRDGVAPTIAGFLFNSLSPYDEASGTFSQGLAREWYFVDKEGNPIRLPCGGIDFDRLEEVYANSPNDYMVVRFVLFDNATWSDGTPVTVEDVYFTFDLAANQALSQHAGALVWVNDLMHRYSAGNLIRQGMFTYDRGAAEAGHHITTEERDTVIYFHVRPSLGGIMPLVSTVLILPKHIISEIISPESPLINREPTDTQVYAFANPVGSGPFKLDTNNTSSHKITLIRRDDYHIRNENGGYLFVPERLVFYKYQDINIAIFALRKGHIDVLNAAISPNFAQLFRNDEHVSVMRSPGQFAQTLVLNVNAPSNHMTPNRELLTNPDFRRALALAICQEELIRFVLNGAGEPFSQGLVGSGQPFYNPNSRIITGGTEAELAEANALLDAIVPDRGSDGYRLLNGRRIVFDILGTPGDQTLIAFLQVQFQRIGIDVAFRPRGSSPENTFLFPGNFDMVTQGVSLTQANIEIMAASHFVNLGRTSNYGRLMNTELGAAVEAMRSTLNQNVAFAIAEEIQMMIAHEYYKIPLYSMDVITVYRTDRFTGFQQVPGAGAFNSTSLQNLVFVGGE